VASGRPPPGQARGLVSIQRACKARKRAGMFPATAFTHQIHRIVRSKGDTLAPWLSYRFQGHAAGLAPESRQKIRGAVERQFAGAAECNPLAIRRYRSVSHSIGLGGGTRFTRFADTFQSCRRATAEFARKSVERHRSGITLGDDVEAAAWSHQQRFRIVSTVGIRAMKHVRDSYRSARIGGFGDAVDGDSIAFGAVISDVGDVDARS